MSSLLQSTRNTRPLLQGSLRWIRSDAPLALRPNEIQWLLAHDVRTLVDLRSLREAALHPCPLQAVPGFFYHHLPVTGGDTVPPTPADVVPSYCAMADQAMAHILAVIEGAPTNVLFFCTAGKDRTGVVSALLLTRLGASRATIVADYMRSAENLGGMLRAYAQDHGIDPAVLLPQEAYITGFLDRAAANFPN